MSKSNPLSEKSIPVLEHWVNLTEAASVLKVSRQYVHKLAQQGVFKTLHRIKGARDVFVVDTSEVQNLADKRETPARERTASEDSISL